MNSCGCSESSKVIVTVLGTDRAGIVAQVSAVLARHNVNILDISQTILQGIFTMTMYVDIHALSSSFSQLQDEMANLAKDLQVQIKVQKEEVFTYMHRL